MMIQAIVPIIIHGSDDILLSKEGNMFILQTMQTLNNCRELHTVTVYSNHRALLDLVPPAKATTVHIKQTEAISSLAIPPRFMPWPRLIPLPEDRAAVLVMSPRNPLLTAGTIDKAIALFKKQAMAAMTTVVASSMHPCQLFHGRPISQPTGPLYCPEQEAFAEKEFFPDVPDLWTRNTDGSTTNRLTGSQILGRQDFPETVEPDGTLLLATPDWLRAAPEHQLNNLHGFKLSPHESICVRNTFDYLRVRATQKAIKKVAKTDTPSGNKP